MNVNNFDKGDASHNEKALYDAVRRITGLPSQATHSGQFLTTNGITASWASVGGGSAVWGGITGTLNNQSDLISFLSSTYQPILTGTANTVVYFDGSGNPTSDLAHTIDPSNDGSWTFYNTDGSTYFNAVLSLTGFGSKLYSQDFTGTTQAAFIASQEDFNIYIQQVTSGTGNNQIKISSSGISFQQTVSGGVPSGQGTILHSYTFPISDGTSGQVLTTDGAGNLSFTNNSTPLVSLTYTAATALIGSIVPGQSYLINDKADGDGGTNGLGILLIGVDANNYSLQGSGGFLNPDFQGVGDYSGVVGLTTIPYTVTQGIWFFSNEVGYNQGDIVFWNNLHYQLVSIIDINGMDPSVNTVAYQILPKTVSNVGYIEEWDAIEYDFRNDWIQARVDKRGNKIFYSSITDSSKLSPLGFTAINLFQWGNDSWYDNTSNEGVINDQNSLIILFGNSIEKDSFISNNLSFVGGTISNNTLLSKASISSNVGAGGVIDNNDLDGSSIISSNDITSGYISNNTLNNSSLIDLNLLLSNATISGNNVGVGSRIGGNLLGSSASINNNSLLSNNYLSENTIGDSAQINENTLFVNIDFRNKILSTSVRCNENIIGIFMVGTDTYTTDIINKVSTYNQSTFDCIIDITGLTTLDITSLNSYCGVINLISSNPTETINTIVNRPVVPYRLNFINFTALTITGTPAASMTVNAIALEGSSYVGDGTHGDFIVFEEWKINSVFCSKQINAVNIS